MKSLNNLSLSPLLSSLSSPTGVAAIAFAGGALFGLFLPSFLSPLAFKLTPLLSSVVGFLRPSFREERLLLHVINSAPKGSPQAVMDALNEFNRERELLIHIGDPKGNIYEEVLRTKKPLRVLELGCYMGYSAMKAAMVLREVHSSPPSGSSPSPLLLSVEFNPLYAAIAARIIDHSGMLNHPITILDGELKDNVEVIRNEYHIDTFDVILIDHWKDCYVRDFLLLEKCGFIGKGTVIVADNIIRPGAPEYKELLMVKKKDEYRSELKEATFDNLSLKDGMLISQKL